jgi:hypothetical protein
MACHPRRYFGVFAIYAQDRHPISGQLSAEGVAYGWDPSTDEQILAALLKLNLERSASGDVAPTGAETEEQSEEDEPE